MDLGAPEIHRTTAKGGCGGLYASRVTSRGWALLADDCFASSTTAIFLGPRRVGKTSLLLWLSQEKPWEVPGKRDFWRALGLLSKVREASVSFGIQEHHWITSERVLPAEFGYEEGTFEVVPHPAGDGLRAHSGENRRGRRHCNRKLEATAPPRTHLRLISTSGQIPSTELAKSSGLAAATAYSKDAYLLSGSGRLPTWAWSSSESNLALSATDVDCCSRRIPMQGGRIGIVASSLGEQTYGSIRIIQSTGGI